MNARAEPISKIATPIEAYARLKKAIAAFDNNFDLDRAWASEAIIAQRPAFWTAAASGNSVAYILMNEANTNVAPLTRLAQRYNRTCFDLAYNLRVGLDTLIPLNAAAVAALQTAYEDFGTFRDASELDARHMSAGRAL